MEKVVKYTYQHLYCEVKILCNFDFNFRKITFSGRA